MVASAAFLHAEEIFIGIDLSKHDILVIFIDVVLSTSFVKGILHVLEALALEEDVQLVVFDLHYVRALTVDENNAVAEF